jgi:Rrf2 family protein
MSGSSRLPASASFHPTLPSGQNDPVRVTAKVDYAVRAATMLAVCASEGAGPVKGERIATSQSIPVKYLENILSELRQAGIIRSQRGAEGGYWLARPAAEITVADVIRAVEGPLAHVRGERAENLDYPPEARALQELWVAVRAALRSVLDATTLADLAEDDLPRSVRDLTADPAAWLPR